MESKIVMDGTFRVTTDGDVFVIKDGTETPAKVFSTGCAGRYPIVSYRENGKQKSVLVHRLIATAFLRLLDLAFEKFGRVHDAA